MKIITWEGKPSVPCLNFDQIEEEANALRELANNGPFPGRNRGCFALHHSQVENPSRNFFVLSKAGQEIMPAKLDGEWVFMNPEIISRDDGPFMEIEGCMSFGFREHKKVPRYKVVAVKFSTSTMDDCIAELHGLPAEIFQHEIDHGKGISIYDR